MPVIKVERNNIALFTYNGPNPFIYHFTLQQKKEKRQNKPVEFKIKTKWESKNGDTIKVESTYTGRTTREFNK
jgi:hypothetical protein